MELVGCPERNRVKHMSKFADSMIFSSGNEHPRYEAPHSGDHSNPNADRDAINRFRSKFPNASEDAIDLLVRLLHFEPDIRVSAKDALKHAYVKQFHDPSVERDASKVVRPPISDDDKRSTHWYRETLYNKEWYKTNSRRSVTDRDGQESRRAY